MKIGIVSIYDFPKGMAATNRMAAYAQGLVECGNEVTVMNVLPTESIRNGIPDNGSYNGVKYSHLCGRLKSKYKLFRMLAHCSGYRFLNGVYRFHKHLENNHYDIIVISNDEPLFLYIYNRICGSKGIKTVFIFDEYPTPIRHKLKREIPTYKKWKYIKILPNFDGYISISNELKEYYNSLVEKPTLIVPLIVNTKRFQSIQVEKKDKISYVGNMEITKDNIDNIIRAFAIISKEFNSYSLHFYGKPTPKVKTMLSQLVESLKIKGRVYFDGPITSDEVPKVIAESKVMVSSQPDTLRAKGGFPTKLGEYIVMGTPTLICDVGENRKYISDEDCFFAKPDDINDYSQKLRSILSDYQNALKVAEHGKKTILCNYSQSKIGEIMSAFFKQLF